MAVPKKKTSKSKRNSRRAHDSLKRLNIAYDSKTGEPKLSHHISVDGFYRGRQVVDMTKKVADEANDTASTSSE